MGLLDKIRKALSSGEPQVAGGDPEAQAMLSEEYGEGDPDVPLERPSNFVAGSEAAVREGPDDATDAAP